MKKSFLALAFALLGSSLWAASESEKTPIPQLLRPSKDPSAHMEPSKAPWLMGSFIDMAEKQPEQLFRIGLGLYDSVRLKKSTSHASFAYDWQHRLAFVTALSQIFNPELKTKSPLRMQVKALKFLEYGMIHDPALIVRDGAVESVRRIVRMDPSNTGRFQQMLHRAFVDRKNVLDGEGLFIRETILTALREASLQLSPSVRREAAADRNLQVRALLDGWKSELYQKL